jgi:hypothetical protein
MVHVKGGRWVRKWTGVVVEVGKQRTWTFKIVLVVFPHLEKQLANF